MAKLKLLFVEDEPDIRDVVLLALGLDMDIETTAFESGREALASLRAAPQTFRYALLNLRLPTMTGIELHEELRALPGMETLKTVIITGASKYILQEIRETPGVVGIIAKPFDPLTLARDIRALFRAR